MKTPLPPRLLLILAATLLLSGCERSSGGPLQPISRDGVGIEDGQVATLIDGELKVRVTGDWSTTGSNGLNIRYRNDGAKPLRIMITRVKMKHAMGTSVLLTAVDYTGVNMTDTREDNDRGRILFSRDQGGGVGVLDVPARSTRELNCYLSSFANEGSVARGDPIGATIPTATGSAEIAFTTIRPQWWIFW